MLQPPPGCTTVSAAPKAEQAVWLALHAPEGQDHVVIAVGRRDEVLDFLETKGAHHPERPLVLRPHGDPKRDGSKRLPAVVKADLDG
jgi:hypothetical protein